MSFYDIILKWKQRFFIVINTMRIRLMFFKNIHFSGFENIHHTVKIFGRSGGIVFLGEHIFADRHCVLASVGGKLTIGADTFFNVNCMVVCREKIDIGPGCMFGPNVCVYDHDHNYSYNGIDNDYKTSQIIIGKNCWIGANVVILRGTHVGDNCVIGAGTVLKGNILPHSIVRSSRELEIIPIIKH